MIKEEIREEACKLFQEMKECEEEIKIFQKILDTLDKVPFIEGMYIKSTNPLIQSYEKGIRVAICNRVAICKSDCSDCSDWLKWEFLQHEAYVVYAYESSSKFWYERTNKTVAQQLFELYIQGKITKETIVLFSFVDFRQYSHKRIIEKKVKFKEILPYIIKIMSVMFYKKFSKPQNIHSILSKVWDKKSKKSLWSLKRVEKIGFISEHVLDELDEHGDNLCEKIKMEETKSSQIGETKSSLLRRYISDPITPLFFKR